MARVEEFYEQARVIHSQFAYCSVCQELHGHVGKLEGILIVNYPRWWQFWKR